MPSLRRLQGIAWFAPTSPSTSTSPCMRAAGRTWRTRENPMNAEKWREIGVRIGAMSLRERLFVFAAAVVVAGALVQTLLGGAARRRGRGADGRRRGARAARV